MIFNGASLRFSTKDEMQYETIGEFWNVMSDLYGQTNIRGLGYNWGNEKIEYVIGFKDNRVFEVDGLKEKYPEICYKEILIADDGYEVYKGKIDELGDTYGRIYKSGTLSYEIETFAGDEFEIMITRKWPELILLDESYKDEILALYRSAIGTPGCVWDEIYPGEKEVEFDINNKCLYGIKDDQGKIIAAVSRDIDEEVMSLPFWKISPAAELARLVVDSKYRSQGIARILIRSAMPKMKEIGYAGVHYLVAKDNEPAIRSYEVLGFSRVGECNMFDHDFYCYEKLCE